MLNKLKTFFSKHTNIFYILAIILILAIIFGGRIFGNSNTTPTKDVSASGLKILPLQDYKENASYILSSGTIESLDQVEMRSQIGANVSKVYVSIGDKVSEGDLLVTLSNSDASAALSQAKANLQAQQARLNQLKGGTRAESLAVSKAGLDKTNSDLQSLYQSAVNTLNGAYVSADDAVRKQIGGFFSNAETDSPQLSFTAGSYQVQINSQAERAKVKSSLEAWSAELNSLSSNSSNGQIDTAINDSLNYLGDVKDLLANLADALNNAQSLPSATLDGYKAALNLARGNVNNSLIGVTGIKDQIVGQKLNIITSQKQYELLLSGAEPEDIKAEEAVVAQASASVDSANSLYQKTIFRSPIGGVVGSVSVSSGDLVSVGASVVTVVNQNGQKITAYVSGEDAKNIDVGSSVLVGGETKAVVSRISPSIDPVTKKVELTILLSPGSSFVVGQYVDLRITGRENTNLSSGSYFVPIQAVKVSDTGSSVFLLNPDNTVAEVKVMTGAVSGELVKINGTLPSLGKIASPVYGLKDGGRITTE